MKCVITFQIIDDIAETCSYHSIVCDEDKCCEVQQKMMSEYAPFIEVVSITPYIEDNDDDNILDDEDIPF